PAPRCTTSNDGQDRAKRGAIRSSQPGRTSCEIGLSTRSYRNASEIRECEPSSGSGSSIGSLDAKHRPALAHHVQLARFIFTKRGDRQRRTGQYRLNTSLEDEDLAGTVIAVDVCAVR